MCTFDTGADFHSLLQALGITHLFTHTHTRTHAHLHSHSHSYDAVKERIAANSKIQSGVGRDGKLSRGCRSVWRNSWLLDPRTPDITFELKTLIVALIHKSSELS
jgi:hypothetical protein